jgi:hypothetical protein
MRGLAGRIDTSHREQTERRCHLANGVFFLSLQKKKKEKYVATVYFDTA